MTLVVGFEPDQSGIAALRLATQLAQSCGENLVVCAIVTTSWPPSPGRIDAEYRVYRTRQAQHALKKARGILPPDLDATFLVHTARSIPAGIIEVASERNASMVVLGSCNGGPFGQVSLGSISDRLLHSSPVPVAIAPRGFRGPPQAKVLRVTAAVGGQAATRELATAAARFARRLGASLRLATFAVRPTTEPFAGQLGFDAEQLVINEWLRKAAADIRGHLDRIEDLGSVPGPLEASIGYGPSWADALEDTDWIPGDILAVGSSMSGPAARVFLGSRASKIIRHSPVPTLLIPNGASTAMAVDSVEALHQRT